MDKMTTTMSCARDWVDGACDKTAPRGTPGWEQRVGRKGELYWLCPEDAVEFPESQGSES